MDSVSLARALSKLGWCSRAQAHDLITAGRVMVDGARVNDPARRVDVRRARIEVDGQSVRAQKRTYLMMHKPRGYVTTSADELGRATVFDLLPAGTPRVNAVGRLDMESEGLLLFTNDTRWADRILDPATHVDKIYEVQLVRSPSSEDLARAVAGVSAGRGETLSFKSAAASARGPDWIEVVLDEGRNRQVRRVLEALGYDVVRLIRVAIGSLELGALGVGEVRELNGDEVMGLG